MVAKDFSKSFFLSNKVENHLQTITPTKLKTKPNNNQACNAIGVRDE